MADDAEVLSFDEYVAARGAVLLRFAYILSGDGHQGEDLVQEALARAYRRWSRISSLDHPEAYLRRMIVNDFLSWKRRRPAQVMRFSDAAEGAADEIDGNDHGAKHANREAMRQLLAGLPKQQRTVLVLRYYEDWNDEQIADQLRCSAATVRSHASKALARLRRTPNTSTILNGAE